jgi:hypothetical protein
MPALSYLLLFHDYRMCPIWWCPLALHFVSQVEKVLESHWRKLFAILVASARIGHERACLCCRIKLVLPLCFGHAIIKACKCQCSVENASFLILRACLVACCGTGCSSLYRASTVSTVCDFKIGISQFRFVSFSRRVCMGYAFCLRQIRKRKHVCSSSFLPLDSVRLTGAGISGLERFRQDTNPLLALWILCFINTKPCCSVQKNRINPPLSQRASYI